jgi:WD40 repeat protein
MQFRQMMPMPGRLTLGSSTPAVTFLRGAKNGGTLEKAAAMANHTSTRTTQLYDRRRDEVSLSPDDKMVAAGGDDRSVQLWSAADGRLLHTLAGHTSYVNSVVFSPDGRIIASGNRDLSVKLWDAASGQLFSSFFRQAMGMGSNISPLRRGDRVSFRRTSTLSRSGTFPAKSY